MRRTSGWGSPRRSPAHRGRAVAPASSPDDRSRRSTDAARAQRSAQRSAEDSEDLGGGDAEGRTELAETGPDALAERLQLTGVGGVHRRLELALVGLQGGELAVDERRHVLDVVRLVGLPQQQGGRAVRGEVVLGEEVGVARGDDGVADQPAGVAVIGMEPVALPRVVAEHDLRLQLADDSHHLRHGPPVGDELAVDAVEEAHLAGTVAGQPARRFALLVAGGGQRAPGGPRTGSTCPWSRPCTRGGGRDIRRPPTWRASRRRRTRRRRDGRRWRARTTAPAGRASRRRRPSAVAVQARSQPRREQGAQHRMGEVVRVVDVQGEPRVAARPRPGTRRPSPRPGGAGTTPRRRRPGARCAAAAPARWCRRAVRRAPG